VEADVFAAAARHDGLDYPGLLHRILALGISRAKRRRIRRLRRCHASCDHLEKGGCAYVLEA
jgi:hypothetical protein